MTPTFPLIKAGLHLFALSLTLLSSAPALAVQSQANPNASANVSQNSRPLSLDKPVERELSGGDSHVYEVLLNAGQFLGLVVDQRGIDIAVTVTSPDGKQIFEMDINGVSGPEPIYLNAEASGSYKINIIPLEKSAPPGRYEIKVIELRLATETDRDLVQAYRLYNESMGLRIKGEIDAALPVAERSLAAFEKSAGPENISTLYVLDFVASIYCAKKEYGKCEQLFTRALTVREKKDRNDPEIATSLINLANLHREKNDYIKAELLLQRALRVVEKASGPNHIDVANVLDVLADLHERKREIAKADQIYLRALNIREKALGADHQDVGYSLNNLALFNQRRKDYAKAEQLFLRAHSVYEKSLGPDKPQTLILLDNLGNLYTEQSNYKKAQEFFLRALQIREKSLGPDHPAVAESFNNLAIVVGRQIQDSIAKGETADIKPLLDADLYMRKILKGQNVSSEFSQFFDFAKGAAETYGVFFDKWAALVKQHKDFEFVKLYQRDSTPVLQFRLIEDTGYLHYWDFYLVRNGKGTISIDDIRAYDTGESLSQQIRESWEYVKNKTSENLLHYEKIKQIIQLINDGKPQQAYTLLESLPDEIKNRKVFMILRIRAAFDVDRDKAGMLLQQIKQEYPDYSGILFLYFSESILKNDFDSQVRLLDEIYKAVQGDERLLWYKLGLLTEQKKYEDATKFLSEMERVYEVDLSAVEQSTLPKEFFNSREYKLWAQQRRKK